MKIVGFEHVRLPEDGVLSGFTPLIFNQQEPTFAPKDVDAEAAQLALRIKKILFFGTVFLCGLEPPVLKLEFENDFSEYISVVRTSASRSQPSSPPELVKKKHSKTIFLLVIPFFFCQNDVNELLVERISEDEEEANYCKLDENASSEIRDLLTRKVELEKRHRNQELHLQRVQVSDFVAAK